jgi:glycosyltransferase involved in cell wall biosynthesis
MGYRQTVTAPVIIDFERLNKPGEGRWRDGEFNWLFVGRIAPNKRQDELIALFAHYQHWVEPHARLILVGSAEHVPSYQLELEVQAQVLGVKSRVVFTGKVDDAELAACYRAARVFVSLSEHEGLGVPLLEALYCGVPVMAYASSAVPTTLADAGILFHQKNWAVLAELIDRVVKDEALRAQLIAQGRQRAAEFAAETVAAQWQAIIQTLLEKR